MRRKILVFGCGELQESLISNAKLLGYYVIGLDIKNDIAAKNLCDRFFVIPGDDFNATCKLVEEFQIDGLITSATDRPLEMMAKISEKYSFVFPTLEAIKNTTNKHLLKNILIKNNIPTANATLLENISEIKNINQFSYPLIVKPVDNSGSRGVIYCSDATSLIESLHKALYYSNVKKVLVEEYIGGEEYSIESLIFKNNVSVIQITKKETTAPPYNVELAHKQPAQLNPIIYNRILEVVKKMASALELNNCACHTETKVYNGIPYIIENGARLGGDYITSHLTPLSSGVNMEQQLLKICIGEPFVCPMIEQNYAYIKYFHFPEGIVEFDQDKLSEIIHPNLVKLEFKLSSGQRIPRITNSMDRYGFIIVNGHNKSEVEDSMNFLMNEIHKVIIIRQ